jgi:hypothetical protein
VFGSKDQVNDEETSAYPFEFRSFSPKKVVRLIKDQAKFE